MSAVGYVVFAIVLLGIVVLTSVAAAVSRQPPGRENRLGGVGSAPCGRSSPSRIAAHTTATAHDEPWMTAWLTESSSSPPNAPRPRVPTTTRPADSEAATRVTSAGQSSTRVVTTRSG